MCHLFNRLYAQKIDKIDTAPKFPRVPAFRIAAGLRFRPLNRLYRSCLDRLRAKTRLADPPVATVAPCVNHSEGRKKVPPGQGQVSFTALLSKELACSRPKRCFTKWRGRFYDDRLK